jgi:hypothetical protein
MFASEEQARAAFSVFDKKWKNFRKRTGDHLASVSLQKSHGCQTAPDETGHFELYEYVDVDLSVAATLIGAL